MEIVEQPTKLGHPSKEAVGDYSDLQIRNLATDVDDRLDTIDIQANEAIHSISGPSVDCGLSGPKSNLPRIQGI